MKQSTSTAREMFQHLLEHPNRQPFGFGAKSALINVDLQCAYTRTDRYPTAYADDPRQFDRVNRLVKMHRDRDWPVIWTTLAYMEDGGDCGVWGHRSDTPDSLQRIGFDSDRARIDDRADFDAVRDMPDVHESPHFANLYDMQAKYADVLATEAIADLIGRVK